MNLRDIAYTVTAILVIGGVAITWNQTTTQVQANTVAIEAERRTNERQDIQHRIAWLDETTYDTMERWTYLYLNAHRDTQPDTLTDKTVEVWISHKDPKGHKRWAGYVKESEYLHERLKKMEEEEGE